MPGEQAGRASVRGTAPPRAVRRKVYSQNFLIDPRAIDALVAGSGVGEGDLVLDIGAGNGLITAALARRGARVAAVEKDPALARRLRTKFASEPGVTVVEEDVLSATFPAEPFQVVANIPFGITTQILRRLLGARTPALTRADVIVQAEVARKRARAGRGAGTLLNACWEPWFEFFLGARIPAAAFRPRPRVDAAVLAARRRDQPLLGPAFEREYVEFVSGAFTGARPSVWSAVSAAIPRARFAEVAAAQGFAADAMPSALEVNDWVALFRSSRAGRAVGA
jgi:23S rRNA (adenine-N6)-dimethyltransferase